MTTKDSYHIIQKYPHKGDGHSATCGSVMLFADGSEEELWCIKCLNDEFDHVMKHWQGDDHNESPLPRH